MIESRLILLHAALALCLALPAPAMAQEKPQAGSLAWAVDSLFAGSCAKRENSAVTIISMDSGEPAYDMNGGLPLMPASVQKLVVSMAALHHLGPAYAFKTRISHTGGREGGVIRGDLYVKGFGDPKLTPEQVWIITEAVRAMGVVKVEGKLYVDGSFFDGAGKAPSWSDNRSQRAYDAGLGALSVSFNAIAVRAFPGPAVGAPLAVSLFPDPGYIKIVNQGTTGNPRVKVSAERRVGKETEEITVSGVMAPGDPEQITYLNVENPASQAGLVFLEYFRRAGVAIAGGWSEGTEPKGAAALYEHKSEPLALILRGLNKYSNNFTAEQVAKTLAAELYGPPGTHEAALKILADFLKETGAPINGVRLADASGLSRENRLTTSALAAILFRAGKRFDIGPEIMAALSVMGVDGSLKKRGSGFPILSSARAKTGSLNGVASLAGYAAGPNGSAYAFAVIMNGSSCGSAQEDVIADGVVAAIKQRAGR